MTLFAIDGESVSSAKNNNLKKYRIAYSHTMTQFGPACT